MTRSVALIYTHVSVLAEKDRARALSPATQLERCRELPALRGLLVEVRVLLDFAERNVVPE